MSRPSLVPSKTEMRRYLKRGLTQKQIAEEWENDTGIQVSRAAIGMAINRYGLESSHPRNRYEDTLPWTVREEHARDHNARMLRLEGRRRRGLKLSDMEKRWLDSYLSTLKERNAVVTYTPELGFIWVTRPDGYNDLVLERYDAGPGERGSKSERVG